MPKPSHTRLLLCAAAVVVLVAAAQQDPAPVVSTAPEVPTTTTGSDSRPPADSAKKRRKPKKNRGRTSATTATTGTQATIPTTTVSTATHATASSGTPTTPTGTQTAPPTSSTTTGTASSTDTSGEGSRLSRFVNWYVAAIAATLIVLFALWHQRRRLQPIAHAWKLVMRAWKRIAPALKRGKANAAGNGNLEASGSVPPIASTGPQIAEEVVAQKQDAKQDAQSDMLDEQAVRESPSLTPEAPPEIGLIIRERLQQLGIDETDASGLPVTLAAGRAALARLYEDESSRRAADPSTVSARIEQLLESEKKLAAMGAEHEELRNRAAGTDALRESVRQLEESNHKLWAGNTAREDEIAQVQVELRNARQAQQAVNERVNNLSTMLHDKDVELNTTREDARQKLKAAEANQARLRDEKEKLQASYSSLQKTHEGLQHKKAAVDDEVENLRRSRATLQKTLQAENGRAEAMSKILERITAGASTAAALEDLQWVAQRRFAKKVDDPSVSAAFLMAAHLGLFQYLRGVVLNDELLQRLGIVNLRTLLQRVEAVTGMADWKPSLQQLVSGALDKQVPEMADLSGPPSELEQLLFISVLNHMGTSANRIDNNLVRISPLYYRADGRRVLGVR